jgi:hypothetical protein
MIVFCVYALAYECVRVCVCVCVPSTKHLCYISGNMLFDYNFFHKFNTQTEKQNLITWPLISCSKIFKIVHF